MTTLPIIQTFFDKPVRFFKTSFELEIRGHDAPQSSRKVIIETWAIPFPDYCRAIEKPEKDIRRMINLNDEVFRPFYCTEQIMDAVGRVRTTILMAQEMCDMLTARLETSRIKDPAMKAMVINFQKNLMYAFHMLRTGRLRAAHWNHGAEVPPKYMRALSLTSGRDLRDTVMELALADGISTTSMYRRLQTVRGSNAITSKGTPKKRKCTAGAYKKTDAYKAVEMCKCQLSTMTNKQIAEATGVSYGKVTRWLRAA